MRNVVLDSWAKSLLVDPIDKSPLEFHGNTVCSRYGRSYSVGDGEIIDFRPFVEIAGDHATTWKAGQLAYESWSKDIARTDSARDYDEELKSVSDVYQAMPITGACLDVGGHQWRLRAFLKPDQQYLIVDPFMNVFDGIDKQPNLINTYPFLNKPVNFVCGVAEHLPLRANSFDVVHMRSVIDHFQNPALALLEAYRVLKANGHLVVGLFVEGGETGRLTLGERAKETIRTALGLVGIGKWADHHVWHPTYPELIELIEASGFSIDRVYWQKKFVDRVCYIKANKKYSKDCFAK